ncbi:hypothetical protein B0H12DRAFT_1146817 [Mycena haematopus]|nr:hypothetical protein B0H12DRAFT_1146817 [Mycena haematopus]
MDSQQTLVSPSLSIRLTFSANSMTNAALSRDSRPAYTITTQLQGSTTDIRASGRTEVLARISRKDFLPDTVKFPNINGGKEVRLSKWMRPLKLPDGSHAHIIETEVGNCVLKTHPVYRLEVFSEHNLDTPIAHWELANETRPLSLMLCAGTDTFYSQVIAAFTIQDLRMRMTEKSSRMAFGRAEMESRVIGNFTPL